MREATVSLTFALQSLELNHLCVVYRAGNVVRTLITIGQEGI